MDLSEGIGTFLKIIRRKLENGVVLFYDENTFIQISIEDIEDKPIENTDNYH